MSGSKSVGSSSAQGRSAATPGNPYAADSSERRSQLTPTAPHPSLGGISRRSSTLGASMSPRSPLPTEPRGNWTESVRYGSATAAHLGESGGYATTLTAPPQQTIPSRWSESVRNRAYESGTLQGTGSSGAGSRSAPGNTFHGEWVASLGGGTAAYSEPANFPTTLEPPSYQTIPTLTAVRSHATQQLVLGGDISGETHAGRSEADQRISQLIRRSEDRHIDWHQVLDELDDEHESGRISENTYLQLANSRYRSLQAKGQAPTAPNANIPEADAQGQWTGHGAF